MTLAFSLFGAMVIAWLALPAVPAVLAEPTILPTREPLAQTA